MHLETVLSADADVVAREVGGETVLLHLGSGTYFGLNEVGGRIWQLLDQGDTTLGALCEAIEAEFDAPRDVVEADLLALAAQLVDNGLAQAREA